MLIPPAGLPEATLLAALERWWGIRAASVQYRPVGWGSHHWVVSGPAGSRWFVTADELENKRLSQAEPLAGGFRRLRAALSAATDLRDCGRTFAVAPVPARDGEPLARVSRQFGGGGLPVRGRPELRVGGVLLARAPEGRARPGGRHAHRPARGPAGVRWPTTSGCRTGTRWRRPAGPAATSPAEGPYARPAARLIRQHAVPIRRLLARYDHLVAAARARASPAVLTHGEPHPGNTMLTAGGWVLIDWDTALAAPPERDLWSLDPGDGSILDAYAGLTGVTPQSPMLDLYRLRWDIADIADRREPVPASARRDRRG